MDLDQEWINKVTQFIREVREINLRLNDKQLETYLNKLETNIQEVNSVKRSQ
jgi:hypothetical protein